MPELDDKVVLLNRGALLDKYGAQMSKIDTALAALIKADEGRGIRTRLIAIDDAKEMRPYAAPVTDKRDESGAKAAVDSIYQRERPDYLVLLGSQDVIPQQRLDNPVKAKNDPDPYVESDIPYACDAPYGTDAGDFRAPDRVVGRIPDVPGSTDPTPVVRLLEYAADAESVPVPSDYFALSAKIWKIPTSEILQSVFSSADPIHLSPPKGASWSDADLAPLIHLINCHGTSDQAEFLGQHGRSYPLALNSKALPGLIEPGTVVAAECCYGAQLYPPSRSVKHPGQFSICLTYLLGAAAGFLGSSCIAYGSPGAANTLSDADLLCLMFLRQIRAGASLGRALAEARQEFVAANKDLDPYALKTLAQFVLLGDPSTHPFVSADVRAAKGFAAESGRSERRDRIHATARQVLESSSAPVPIALEDLPREEEQVLRNRLPSGAEDVEVTMYAATETGEFPSRAMKGRGAPVGVQAVVAYHVATTQIEDPESGVVERHAVVARTVRGQVADLRHIVSR